MKVRSLKKSISRRKIFEDLNFEHHRGILIVKGPNGSGKTTLLRIIAGLDRNYEGDVLLHGKPTYYLKHRISYLGHKVGIYMDFTVKENLEFFKTIYNCDGRKLNELLVIFSLRDYLHFKASELSRGNLQKLGIVRTLMKDAELFVMDEPTTSLDSSSVKAFTDILNSFKHKIIVLSTHTSLNLEHDAEITLEGH